MNQRILTGAFFVFLLLLLDCGGGSSDGGSPEAPYTGLQNQAALNEENASQIIMSAFYGGAANSSVSPFGAVESGSGVSTTCSLPAVYSFAGPARKTALVLSNSIRGSVPPSSSTLITQAINVPGDCEGGNITGTVTVDDETGVVSSGSITFNEVCVNPFGDEQAHYNGTISFTGSFNPDTLEGSLDFTFSNFEASFEGQALTVNGAMSMTLSGDTTSIEMNIYSQDGTTGKTYWYKDYGMTITDYYTYEQAAFSGLFYDPDYGYVELTTEETFIVNADDEFFSSGVLIAEGSGYTKAKLTALSSTTYKVEADLDGDGTYERTTGPLNWADGYQGIDWLE